jgi:hypothetical protein
MLYNPTFSVALGMICFALDNPEYLSASTATRPSVDIGGIGRIVGWFRQNF